MAAFKKLKSEITISLRNSTFFDYTERLNNQIITKNIKKSD